jgi:hypothetical protein
MRHRASVMAHLGNTWAVRPPCEVLLTRGTEPPVLSNHSESRDVDSGSRTRTWSAPRNEHSP